MICSGILGYAMVLFIFFYEEIFFAGLSFNIPSDIEKGEFLNHYPMYLIWLTVMLVQGVLWFILIFPATAIIINLKDELKGSHNEWKSIVIIALVFALFMWLSWISFIPYMKMPGSAFAHHSNKLPYFTLTGRVVALYFLFGVVLVGRVFSKMLADKNFSVINFKRLRGQMDTLLNYTGIVLSLGVMTSIIFNNSVYSDTNPDLFPRLFVVVFGLMNTLLMVIIYLPSQFVLHAYGRRLVENTYPIKGALKEEISEKLGKQNEFTKLINLNLSFPETIKKSIVILSPLLSSFLPKLFDLFGK
jgi:hypothetical protein